MSIEQHYIFTRENVTDQLAAKKPIDYKPIDQEYIDRHLQLLTDEE